MQFMYVLRLTEQYRNEANWTEETKETVSQHFNYLKGLYENGVMKLVGKTDYDVAHDENRGFAIFEADSMEKANYIMNNDPCIVKGVMTAKLHPFNIALYKGQ
ncbi:MAG: YciI family protein [Bacteroidota bacterium]